MFRYDDGTVFNAGTDAMVNTVNTAGVMGRGIALDFRLRYPEMFEDYKKRCGAGEIVTGKVCYYRLDDGKVIVNFPTKKDFRYPSQLSWIKEGLADFVKTYRDFGFRSVAFPPLGASLGKLPWEDVRPVMEHYLKMADLDAVICMNTKTEAEGIEKKMVSLFNAGADAANEVNLRPGQREALEQIRPIDRFYRLADVGGLGKKSYENLYRYYYLLAVKGDQEKQLSLFDQIR